jgi:hypothetical protein
MSYLGNEFAKLGWGDDGRLKITSEQGETDWIDISPESMSAILLILKREQDKGISELIERLGL